MFIEHQDSRPATMAEPAPGSSTVWQRFFMRAAERSGAVALEWKDRSISYGELKALVVRLAALLPIAPGTKPVVAIHGNICPAYIATLMAVMSRGAIVLPIDERLPEVRKRKMAELAEAALTITCSDTNVAPLRTVRWMHLSPEGKVLDGEPGLACLPGIWDGFEDAAYIFFTSGTTGTPKGVLGRASSLDHFVTWQCTAFALGPGDRIAPFTNLSFDPSLRDQFSMLCAGGTLALPHEEARNSIEGTLAFVRSKAPTVLHIVPTLARHWLRMTAAHPTSLNSLRLTFFAGEPLLADLVTVWRERAPASVVVNLYGPTETTLARFHWVVPHCAELNSGPLAVGTPIWDTGFMVLGEDGTPAGPSETGEILIDTAFSSYGYLGEHGGGARFGAIAGLTPRFGKTFFRTGDCGTVDTDGNLVVLGRLDSQLKISGVRIDPLEVAETLKTHPRVREAFVGAHRMVPDMLVAWYVPIATGEPPLPNDLRAFLRERMIAAMIPAIFLALDAMPITSSGKIDRAALDNLLQEQNGETTAKPLSDTEAAIIEIMRSVFGKPQGNCKWDFFTLGGDSLKAAEMAVEVRKRLGVTLAAFDILQNPSLEALASVITARQQEGSTEVAEATDIIWPCSYKPAEGVHALSTRQAAYMAVCMQDRDANWCILSRIVPFVFQPSDESLRAAFAKLVRLHDVLRLEFPDVFRDATQHFRAPAHCDPVDLEIARFNFPGQTYAECQDAVMRIRADGSQVLFDLSKWPLLRMAVLSFEDISAVIIWAHHLVVDGPALNILVDELVGEMNNVTPTPTESAPVGYLEYVRWCATEAIGPGAESNRAYWRNLLAGFSPLALPERQDSGAARGQLFTRPFPPSLIKDVLSVSSRRGCTPFVVLLAAYLRVLATNLGRSDVAVIIPVQIRPPAFSGTIGMFFSQLVVRHNTAKGTTDWHRSLPMQIEAGLSHSGVEFHQRLAELGMTTSGSHYPLTTALFNQNRLARTQSYLGATPFGHHDLGRDLRFQIQGEMQTMGDDFLISYLYRKGVFPTHSSIEAFASEVVESVATLCMEEHA